MLGGWFRGGGGAPQGAAGGGWCCSKNGGRSRQTKIGWMSAGLEKKLAAVARLQVQCLLVCASLCAKWGPTWLVGPLGRQWCSMQAVQASARAAVDPAAGSTFSLNAAAGPGPCCRLPGGSSAWRAGATGGEAWGASRQGAAACGGGSRSRQPATAGATPCVHSHLQTTKRKLPAHGAVGLAGQLRREDKGCGWEGASGVGWGAGLAGRPQLPPPPRGLGRRALTICRRSPRSSCSSTASA